METKKDKKVSSYELSELLKKIKEIRRNKKIGQKEMGILLHISTSGYAKIESGENVLSIERFLDICKILDIKSYNQILPEINIDAIAKIELTLLNAGNSFDIIRKNSMYANRLLDKLLDRIKSDIQPDQKELIQEIEMVGLYIETLSKESLRNDISITSMKDVTSQLD